MTLPLKLADLNTAGTMSRFLQKEVTQIQTNINLFCSFHIRTRMPPSIRPSIRPTSRYALRGATRDYSG